MKALILFFISILPVILIGAYIYRKDYDKEPRKLLIKLFGSGILSCLFVLLMSELLFKVFPILAKEYQELNMWQLIIKVFLGIALVEEFWKWIFVYKISYHSKYFDHIYDMIIYATFVSLGFAFLENILYVFSSGIGVGLFRAITSVPGHASHGVMMGYYLGLAKLSEINNNHQLKKKNMILSLIVPTILHGIYDYCLMTGKVIFVLLFFIFVILLYIYAVKRLKKFSLIKRKIKYKYNYCPFCGYKVNSDYCPICGHKNE